jgi:hypothetical protein
MSADDREMHRNLNDNDYVGMAAVLLNNYALHHGYDFLKLTGNSKGLVNRIRLKYKNKININNNFLKRIGDTKRGPSSFHPGFMQFRASSWAKLPHVWHALTTYGHHYDYIWFMDSDATINPKLRNRSLFDSMQMWKNDISSISWGVKDPFEADMMFFSNFPWREDLPCAGIFILKPINAEKSLREWWDYDLEAKNMADFMEQDALWYMIQANLSYGFSINAATSSLITENQFPSDWHGLNDLWLAHIPSYLPQRIAYFKTMLKNIGLMDQNLFETSIDNIINNSHLAVDIVDVAEQMELRHLEHGLAKRSYYPTHFKSMSTGEQNWRTSNSVSCNTKVITTNSSTLEKLFEGMAISISGGDDIWLIKNGTRRAFLNKQSFKSMGYSTDMIFLFDNKDQVNSIPIEKLMPTIT